MKARKSPEKKHVPVDVSAATIEPLGDGELRHVSGGSLSSALSEVMKNFGGALQTAARGG